MRLDPRANLAALLLAPLAGASCDRTKTLTFVIDPACPGQSCDTIDVGCVTHLLVEYLDPRQNGPDGAPLSLARTCHPVSPKPSQKLCTFGELVGSQIGLLPPMPTDRPFLVGISGFSRTALSTADCQPGDLVFGGVTPRSVDLSRDAPASVPVEVSQCKGARCGGVSGTVIDLETHGAVTDAVFVEFGYVDLGGTFWATSRPPASVPACRGGASCSPGAFSLSSDESAIPSSYGCRAYKVTGNSHEGVFCHPDRKPLLPIQGVEVVAASRELVEQAGRRLDDLVQRSGGPGGGFVLGRILSIGSGVAGARISRTPGACPPLSPELDPDRCVWYPNASFTGLVPETDALGFFISAYETDLGVDPNFDAQVVGNGDRKFQEALGFYPSDSSVCVVEINENTGT